MVTVETGVRGRVHEGLGDGLIPFPRGGRIRKHKKIPRKGGIHDVKLPYA